MVQLLAVVMGPDTESAGEQAGHTVALCDARAQFQFLYHPGRVFWLRGPHQSGAGETVTRVPAAEADKMAETLEIFETMVSDHIHTAYREMCDASQCCMILGQPVYNCPLLVAITSTFTSLSNIANMSVYRDSFGRVQ